MQVQEPCGFRGAKRRLEQRQVGKRRVWAKVRQGAGQGWLVKWRKCQGWGQVESGEARKSEPEVSEAWEAPHFSFLLPVRPGWETGPSTSTEIRITRQ